MEQKTHHGLIAALLLIGLAALPPAASAAVGPPDSCLAYAYSSSDGHYFLAGPNAIMYGSNLTVVHDCLEDVVLTLDGSFVARSNESFNVPIEPGNYTLSLILNNSTIEHQVQIRPDRLSWEIDWELFTQPGSASVPVEEATRMQNWASAMTGLIVWVLATYVYWNLVNAYVQRNFIEEVKQ